MSLSEFVDTPMFYRDRFGPELEDAPANLDLEVLSVTSVQFTIQCPSLSTR
jgi:hypothetical protein